MSAAVPQPDPVIATTTRLAIVALLAPAEEMEFAAVRDALTLSDSALSKQATALQAVGYVGIRKGYVGKRPRTWLKLTPTGRRAFHTHVAALNAIVAGSGLSIG